jgi:hypothetical protein
MSVYCIASWQGVGCTFFDWTIHFLSGQENFYRADQREWIPLCQDPVTNVNAHAHKKNHPAGLNDTVHQLKHLLSQPQNQLYSTYPHPMRPLEAASHLGVPADKTSSQDDCQKILQLQKKDYCQILEQSYDLGAKVIYVDTGTFASFYFTRSRFLEKSSPTQDEYDSLIDEQQQIFFQNSINTWNQIDCRKIWDIRERQALDSRPFDKHVPPDNNFELPHLWIDCRELWTRGENVALRMLTFLELELVPERLQIWREIYAKWQTIQLKHLEFDFVYQHIVDSIVNNWYYEIDLAFWQEVVVQHCLIYQYNLNLKTWQLEKFPNNTQDLHKLLEPNIHQTDNIYNI